MINQLPLEVQKVMVTQEDQFLVLDPNMVLMEYFGTQKLDPSKDLWEVIKDYNNFVFNQKVKVLIKKNQHLKEQNDFMITECQYMKWVSAECITVMKFRNIDTSRILSDAKKKRVEADNARKQMEENKVNSKITSLI